MKPIRKIETTAAPKAIGPYSQAIHAGEYLFISGQLPIDPETQIVIEGGIRDQSDRVIQNIQAILTGECLTLENLVKVEVFLKNMNDFTAFNEVYASYFTHEIKPARFVIEAARLPKDVSIEIACTAYTG